jgi:anti-anti-sigma factor
MNISLQSDSGILVATLSGRLDSMTSPDVQNTLVAQINQVRGNLILDLACLEYLSSAGLRVLLTAVTTTKGLGRTSVVVVNHPHIREILQISGFSGLVASFDDLASARAAVS